MENSPIKDLIQKIIAPEIFKSDLPLWYGQSRGRSLILIQGGYDVSFNYGIGQGGYEARLMCLSTKAGIHFNLV